MRGEGLGGEEFVSQGDGSRKDGGQMTSVILLQHSGTDS